MGSVFSVLTRHAGIPGRPYVETDVLRHEELTHAILGAAIEVHKGLGPGLLESAYETCLCYALTRRQIPFERQLPLPVTFDGVKLDCGYRMDLVVGGQVVVEVKSVEALLPIHEAQLLTYLRLSGLSVGLAINFNARKLKDGILRRVL